MIIKASLNYLNISPRKVRLVTEAIKGLEAKKAIAQLSYIHNRASKPILKLLLSAIANAHHNFNISEASDLYIKNIFVIQGPMLKRWRPRAFGRAFTVRKRRSHVIIEIEAEGSRSVAKNQKKVVDEHTYEQEKTNIENIKLNKEKQPFFNKKEETSRKIQDRNVKKRFFQRKAI
jgi:large subunit ribosomal protein L22